MFFPLLSYVSHPTSLYNKSKRTNFVAPLTIFAASMLTFSMDCLR